MDVKIIPVYSGDYVDIYKLRVSLEEKGIKVLIRNDDITAATAGFVNISRPAIELCILQVDVEKARPVVEEFKKTLK